MITGDVTLSGLSADVVWFYHTAAVCSTWRVNRGEQGYWTFSAHATRADRFQLRQRELIFRVVLNGQYQTWPVRAITLHEPTMTLSGALGPPL
jgi:hypothetical protein